MPKLWASVNYSLRPTSCKEIQLLKDNVYSHRRTHCYTESKSFSLPPSHTHTHKHTYANTHRHKATIMKDGKNCALWVPCSKVILPCVWSSQLQRGWTTHHISATESQSRHCNLHQARPSCLCLSQSSHAGLRAGTPPDWTQSAASALLLKKNSLCLLFYVHDLTKKVTSVKQMTSYLASCDVMLV